MKTRESEKSATDTSGRSSKYDRHGSSTSLKDTPSTGTRSRSVSPRQAHHGSSVHRGHSGSPAAAEATLSHNWKHAKAKASKASSCYTDLKKHRETSFKSPIQHKHFQSKKISGRHERTVRSLGMGSGRHQTLHTGHRPKRHIVPKREVSIGLLEYFL